MPLSTPVKSRRTVSLMGLSEVGLEAVATVETLAAELTVHLATWPQYVCKTRTQLSQPSKKTLLVIVYTTTEKRLLSVCYPSQQFPTSC
jgi:hypothetical protein